MLVKYLAHDQGIVNLLIRHVRLLVCYVFFGVFHVCGDRTRRCIKSEVYIIIRWKQNFASPVTVTSHLLTIHNGSWSVENVGTKRQERFIMQTGEINSYDLGYKDWTTKRS